MNCKNCGHSLIQGIDTKTNKVVLLHYNRTYFGQKAINHPHCSMCEIEGDECENPELNVGGKKYGK